MNQASAKMDLPAGLPSDPAIAGRRSPAPIRIGAGRGRSGARAARKALEGLVPTGGDEQHTATMLVPSAAWRILCRATGAAIARSTFYRWVTSGRVYSVRLGFRIYIPWPSLDELIRQCKAGERV